MTEKSRLEMLEEWVGARPADAFSRYALALELRSAGRAEEAVTHFQKLHEANPDYVPGYLMHGQILNQLGRPDDARAILEKGIATAERVGNRHALGEMQDLLSSL